MTQYYCLLRSNTSRCGIQRQVVFARSFICVMLILPFCQTGICIRTLDAHTETVSALAWVPDGSGFLSGSQDRKIILWVRLQFLMTINTPLVILVHSTLNTSRSFRCALDHSCFLFITPGLRWPATRFVGNHFNPGD